MLDRISHSIAPMRVTGKMYAPESCSPPGITITSKSVVCLSAGACSRSTRAREMSMRALSPSSTSTCSASTHHDSSSVAGRMRKRAGPAGSAAVGS